MIHTPDVAELLQRLIRFATVNPPGIEEGCILYIRDVLAAAGVETQLYTAVPGRPNLVARLPGAGKALPLLLYGHVDVVTVEGQTWSHPPFGGELVEGELWGRGALDMKGGVAMILAALLGMRSKGMTFPGDIILAILSDEEAGGTAGAAWLVERHPHLFAGVRYAIGEFGGFSTEIAGKRFYPIQVAEKQSCRVRVILTGAGGHGALPVRNGAMGKLGQTLIALERCVFPVHLTPVVQKMIGAIASALPFPAGNVIRLLGNTTTAAAGLRALGERGEVFQPLLRNTVNPTILYGGENINVIPERVSVELDGRILPGMGPADLEQELQWVIGKKGKIEILDFVPGPAAPNMGLYGMLAGILREADPEGTPVPMLLPGVTDARHFSKLGIQTYGFLPMKLPPEMNFTQLIHAANERIPVAALKFGTEALSMALQRYTE